MSQIPDELADAVRRAADLPTAHSPDLHAVEQRWRRHRRRRMTMAAAGTGALLAIGAVALPPLAKRGTDAPPASLPTQQAAAVATPAQRLLLGGGGAAISAGANNTVVELLPDSSTRQHRIPPLDGWNRILPLVDGRLTGLRYDKARARLVVLSPTGTVESNRVIAGPVRLVAATSLVAYLWRPAGLAEHRLADGRERLALTAAAVGKLPDNLSTDRLDAAAGKLVVGGTPANACRLRVIGPGNSRATELGLEQLGCTGVRMVRVSPDGRRVAVNYLRGAGGGQARIAIIGLDGGAVDADAELGRPPAVDAATVPKQPAAMAWQDNGSVRAAVVEGLDAGGIYRPDQIRQLTLKVG